MTAGQIRPDKIDVRSYPPRNEIHDEGLDLEADQTYKSHEPQRSGSWPLAPQANEAIDDLEASTNSCTTPQETRRS
jgi:hypothetical protein